MKIEDDCIMLCLAGSRLYGIHNEDSDYDYRGIFVEPSEQIFGSDTIKEEIEFSPDTKYYGLKKFINLSKNGNPNITELWYAREYAISSVWWQNLLACKKDLISQKIVSSYVGWAKSRYKKILPVGDAYDYKAASHFLRICMNGCDLMADPNIFNPTITDESYLSLLREVKQGEMSFNDYEYYSHIWYSNLREEANMCEWASVPDMSRINQVMRDIYTEIYARKQN